MYLKYHKAGLTPITPVTSIVISPVKMSIGRKSLTNLRSEMIFLQGKPVFYIFLPSTPPYWQIILIFCWQWTPKWQQSESRSRATYFRLSVVLGFYHCLTKHTWEVQKEKFGKRNYISVLLLYNYNVFLNTIISYALFLVLFAYQEALKFSFILSFIFWRLVMFLVFSNYIW